MEKQSIATVRDPLCRPLIMLLGFAVLLTGCGDPGITKLGDEVATPELIPENDASQSEEASDAGDVDDVDFDDADAHWDESVVDDVPEEPEGDHGTDEDDAASDVGDANTDVIVTPDGGSITAVKAPFKVEHEFPDKEDGFGRSVAISGDTVVIGVPGDDGHVDGTDRYLGILGDPAHNMVSSYDSGAVYVLDLEGNVLAFLKALDIAPQDRTTKTLGWADRLGTSIAIDGNIVVAGAPGWEDDAGKAYVFERDPFSGRWRQSGQLVPEVSTAGSLFGQSVAVSGDVIVVGAPREDGSGAGTNGSPFALDEEDSGAAYVFERDDGYWRQTAYLKAFDSDAGDLFGTSVAIDGNEIAVGAPLEASQVADSPLENHMRGAGAVYLYDRSASSWRYHNMVKSPWPNYGDFFGESVALDRDADNVLRLAVGAPYANVGGEADAGTVTVFDLVDLAWVVTGELSAPNMGGGHHFGYAVSLDGDFIAVGAPRENTWEQESFFRSAPPNDPTRSKARDSGAVYVFKRGSSWNLHGFSKFDASWDSFYGISVAIESGRSAFVAGAKTTELSIPGRAGAAVISPVSPPRFNSELQLPPTLPVGGAVASF